MITVFSAIFALIPRTDLILTFYRVKPFEKWSAFIIVVAIIPFLILFPNIAARFKFFQRFTVAWGLAPSTIAFLLFYISFLWLMVRLFWVNPKAKADKRSIGYYTELLNEQSFEEFFKLFTKYTSTVEINKHWIAYKQIVFHPKFLQGVLKNQASFLLQFWQQFSSEKDFQTIFRLFLENENSAYYKEIKEHWNTYSLLDDKPFLNKVIRDNLQQSIHNGLFLVFADYVSNHLQAEHDKTSIYNQPHIYPRIREEEGYDLPLYYHIIFIALLYSSAIENKIDISILSHRYTNMQSIYANMVEGMINNIDITQVDDRREYPTNYHWLISEMLSLIDNWLTTFSEENNFSNDSSYIDFIPFCFSLCMNELYKGFSRGKVSQKFINSMMYYHMLSDYFSHHKTNDEMRTSIENNILEKIPKEHLEPIFDFALDEKFAMHYYNLVEEDYRMMHSGELQVLRRLQKFLKERNKFE